MRLSITLDYEVYIKDDVIYGDSEFKYPWRPAECMPRSFVMEPPELRDKVRTLVAGDGKSLLIGLTGIRVIRDDFA